MLVTRCALVLLGIVLVQAHPDCNCGCGTFGVTGSVDLSWPNYKTSACGLGSGESMCDGSRRAHSGYSSHGGYSSYGGYSTYGSISAEEGTDCAPLVVRPQPIPKPPAPLPVSTEPVPGPCACKKAIVKPAVLPKPVCRVTPEVGGYLANYNLNSHSATVLDGSATVIGGSCYNPAEYPPIVLDANSYNQANFAPADAISIALAQQKAKEQSVLTHSEDRLTFGFRKIPLEVPKVVVRKESIPEEMIFGVNGQVVELKPVKVVVGKSVDEEAAEDLMALAEEEHTCDGRVNQGFRRISLGEIGYGPAKLASNTFVDIPASAVEAAAGAVEGAVGAAASSALGSLGSALGSAVSAAGSALGLDASASDACNSGFVAGNVIFKTVPKPKPICVPPPKDLTDCESEEEEQTLSSELSGGTTHIISGACLPCLQNIFKHSHASSSSSTCSHKSKLLIEKCSSL